MSEIFQERGGTTLIYRAPDQTQDAFKGACDYLHASIIPRLGVCKAKSCVTKENSDCVARGYLTIYTSLSLLELPM